MLGFAVSERSCKITTIRHAKMLQRLLRLASSTWASSNQGTRPSGRRKHAASGRQRRCATIFYGASSKDGHGAPVQPTKHPACLPQKRTNRLNNPAPAPLIGSGGIAGGWRSYCYIRGRVDADGACGLDHSDCMVLYLHRSACGYIALVQFASHFTVHPLWRRQSLKVRTIRKVGQRP